MSKTLPALLLLVLLGNRLTAQIGFGTASPHSSLDVRGGIALLPQVITTDLVADASNNTLVFTGTAAAIVTLPDATTCNGRVYWIKNASATLPTPVLTLQPAAAQTVGGFTAALLGEPNETIRLVSNGAGWEVYSENTPARRSGNNVVGWYQGGNTLGTLRAVGTLTNFDMAFKTSGLERMRINTSGFMGIGTAAPAGRLHVVNENSESGNDYLFDDYGSGITAGMVVQLQVCRCSHGAARFH